VGSLLISGSINKKSTFHICRLPHHILICSCLEGGKMPQEAVEPDKELLVSILDQAFNKSAWHGTNLYGSINRLSLEQLLWKPASGRHNIWEIVLHTAYWKYAVWRRLTDGTRGGFPRSPGDWPNLPESLSIKNWRQDRNLLLKQHNSLRQAILDCPRSRLISGPPKSKWTFMQLIYGIASHDLYHAGQIQLLKRLQTPSG
jgi:uncharacterized damage-inducible protein DinB